MENIVQFECFETALNAEDFITQWQPLAKQLVGSCVNIMLHERCDGNNKFRYISKHAWPKNNFSFRFIKGRNTDFFNQHTVRIVQAGGYLPLQVDYNQHKSKQYEKIILFLPVTQVDIQQFKDLSFHRYLNIYQSYYESCLYSYILEFYVHPEKSTDFLQWLTEKKYLQDFAVYKNCAFLQS